MESPLVRTSPKLAGLDCLRGIGAVVVVAHHLMLAFHPWAVLGDPQAMQAPWESGFQRFPASLVIAGRFAVQLFFVLSGVVLSLGFFGHRARSDSELAAAAFKRTFRLAPMVILGVVLMWVAANVVGLSADSAAKLSGSTWLATKPIASMKFGAVVRDVGLNLFLKSREYNSPLWTIGTELYGSFLVFFVVFVVRRLTWRWLVYAGLLAWLRSDDRLPFLFGVILADLHRSTDWFRGWSAKAWVLFPAFAFALLLGSFPLGLDLVHQRQWIPGGSLLVRGGAWNLLLGALVLVAIPMGSPAVDRLLGNWVGRYLGRISYALYATHEIVILTLCSALYVRWRPGLGAVWAGLAAAAVGFPVMILLAEIVTRAVDQPSLKIADWVATRFLGSLRDRTHSPKASI